MYSFYEFIDIGHDHDFPSCYRLLTVFLVLVTQEILESIQLSIIKLLEFSQINPEFFKSILLFSVNLVYTCLLLLQKRIPILILK